MTTLSLRRLSGSSFAALFAVAIAAGCSENQGPVTPSGTGGDVAPVPPSPLCGTGDRLSPHTVLKIGTSFARRCKLIRKLRLTMRLDPKRNILAQQLDHVRSVWLR